MYKYFIILVTTLSLAACIKEKPKVNSLTSDMQLSINNTSEYDIDSLRTWYVYESTQYERLNLWSIHFDYIYSLGWNEEQKIAISRLFPLLKIETFSDSNQAHVAQQVVEGWLQEHLSLFTQVELYTIVGVPINASISSVPSLGGGITQSICECSQRSDYCGWPVGGSSRCDKPCEVNSSWGCGSLWLYSCDGSCI